ncbi:uncharacterized protein N7477_008608 [Penicillium maclennaniae]|uniref:uncharacterized protein n=1 Tax=Penicillium maclennaniae TaxID=1343394 RepID=UPI0025416423|nr:uncharacterized protein N7477_008608 [Penicillium maclennaniae]KAJ5666160.1 hypothetical protein N7477_008608 [Penicillium maclennaniae]
MLTYRSCWTCRSRKVKCDERHQNGCMTCEKAAVRCAGYGIQLCWVTDKNQDRYYRQRRQIKLNQPMSPCLPEHEINEMLFTLDTVSTPMTTVSLGPFSIFQSKAVVGDGKGVCSGQGTLERSCHGKRPASGFRPSQSPQESTSSFPITGDESDLYPDSDRDTFGFSSAGCGRDLVDDDDLLATVLDDLDEPSTVDETFTSCLTGHTTSFAISPSLNLELPVSLFRDPDTSMLMYHYTSHVAELLQPVWHPGNPWKTMYFQFALEGCPELAFTQSEASSSKISTAIFHSVLSSAAFHLRNAKDGSQKFHELGLQHKTKALQALNTANIHPNDSHLHTVYLTAILSLVTIDTMTGEDSEFPIHLNGCQNFRKIQYKNEYDDGSRQVHRIANFLTLLARTTSFEILDQDWQEGQPLFENPFFHDCDRSIEYIYGVTPTLCNLLQRTCRIAKYLAARPRHDVPRLVSEACWALKVDILAWELDSDQFHLEGSETTMIEIARCQAKAFHSALLLFFYRVIGMSSSLDLDHEVSLVLENLTLAEELKNQYMPGEKRNGPMSWPAFIGSCEATDRRPWVDWWNGIQEYRVGNFKRQWMVIQEVWDIMDEDLTVKDWREALFKSGKLVLPI